VQFLIHSVYVIAAHSFFTHLLIYWYLCCVSWWRTDRLCTKHTKEINLL